MLSWWDLEQSKDGVGYQAYQAMIALAPAAVWLGLAMPAETRLRAEHHTDFIFSIIGEELV